MKALLRSFAAVSAAFCLASQAVHAHGFIVVQPPHGGPIHAPIVPPGHFSFAPLAVKEVSVHTKIRDLRVETTVGQLFHNPNSWRLEGT